MRTLACLPLLLGAIALVPFPRDASACGGCFVPQTERTVVTDHRMALSISRQRTVLWDQIQYDGDPREFAWVLPVRAGSTLEVSNDDWFTALDASTQPVVYEPNTFGGSVGCALTGCASETSAMDSAGPGGVQVLSQSVVGPYETVTLRATDPDALTTWLKSNDFAIPAAIEPTIHAYVDEEFDFIALRLRPDCGERAMQPVRVVTNGADPTLPLRMVAAGVGARVGITLWVIAEGRYRPQNFASSEIDDDLLRWDRFESRSNYDALSQEIMGRNGGRTWLTEFADNAQIYESSDPRSYRLPSRGSAVTPGLADAYFAQCRGRRLPSSDPSTPTGLPFTPCPKPGTTTDGGTQGDHDAGDHHDAGVLDASTDTDLDAGDLDGGENDAGQDHDGDAGDPDASPDTDHDAGDPPDDGVAPLPADPCAHLDDLELALDGLHPNDVWVTRLRAVLPADALQLGDLRLEAARPQERVSNLHFVPYYADEDAPAAREGCVSAPKQRTAFGSWALAALSALGLVALLRRRR
jgi:hypothetical protein